MRVFVHDPIADPAEAKADYGIELLSWEALPAAEATVLAVAHRALIERPAADYAAKTVAGGCLVDVKSRLARAPVREVGVRLWRL